MRKSDDLFAKPGPMSRRNVLGASLATAAVAGAVALGHPFRPASRGRKLRIATFGGDFEQAFIDHIYPAFTAETGIQVQSVSRPGGVQFLLQLAFANKSGSSPIDLCCVADTEMMRGRNQKLWRPLDPARLPNLAAVSKSDLNLGPDGLFGAPAMAWFVTLAANPHELKPLPSSWEAFWEPSPDAWGVQVGGTSPLFEIAAALKFGGVEILDTKAGIDRVIAEMAKIKPNVKLWWLDEGTMQTALQNDEVAGGAFLHDITRSLAAQGTSVQSIFPKEGAVRGLNMWCQPTASPRRAEADAFINFSCSPKAQELIARHLGCGPIVPRRELDLTDAEFAAVSTETTSIPLALTPRVHLSNYLETQFTKMVSA